MLADFNKNVSKANKSGTLLR